MAVFTQRKANWIRWITPEEFRDNDLVRIITFFVFHSPCKDLSAMRKDLSEYGWGTPWRKPYYLNKQLKQASSNYELIYSAHNYDALEQALKKADLYNNFPSNLFKERVCIYDNQKNQFLSVFYHLRNAFAHGRVNIVNDNGECIFVLEDVLPNKSSDTLKVSARMILRKSTLLKWIELIEGKEKIYLKDKE